MITLITGTPGSGKTLYAVTRLIKEIESNPDRPIYSDIKGLKIEGVLPVPDDWRDTPEGSLLVYDECQYREMYTRARGKTRFQAILDLTTHRHTGRDIWLITQSPHFLHVDVLAVVGEHIHVDRPMGAKLANIYKWRQAELKPQGRTVKDKAESRSLFKYDKKVFEYYDSVDVGDDKANHKGLKIPKILYFAFGGGALFILYALYGLYSDYQQKTSNDKPKIEKKTQYDQAKETQQPITNTNSADSNPFTTDTKEQPELTKEQLEQKLKVQEQQFKLELEKQKLEMIMQYEQLHKQFAEQQKQLQDFYARLEMYKTMLPKNYEIIKNDPNLQVRAVVKMGNKCNAYNTNGDLMTLSFDECDYYLKASGRVHRAAANGGTGATVTKLETKPVADILAENPDSHKQPPVPSQVPPNPPSTNSNANPS